MLVSSPLVGCLDQLAQILAQQPLSLISGPGNPACSFQELGLS